MQSVLNAPLTPDSPLWAWAYDAISHRAEEMLTHIHGVRVGEDIEAVHDMRVGSRRLVAAMKVFRSAFPGYEFDRLLAEARRVTRRLGAVRDLDVLIDYFAKLRPDADEAERLGIDYFIAVQQYARTRARRPMLAAMREVEAGNYIGRVQRYLRHQAEAYAVGFPPYRTGGGASLPSFRLAGPPILADCVAEFYAFEEHVPHPEHADELHEMRIKAKWLRYTMELFAPAYSDELKSELAVVKRFQELLGDLHDADVRLDLLAQMVQEPLSARGVQAVGLMLPDPVIRSLERLHVREESVRAACYLAFFREWKKQDERRFGDALRRRLATPDA